MTESQVVLITGSRKGIGRSLAEYYAAAGYRVIGCSRTAAEYSISNYRHYCLDVADETAVKKMFTDIRRKEGRLDILLNNAGVASLNHALLTPISTVRRIFDTNVIGTFLFCREAARLMQANRYGRIVNFTTVAVPLKLDGEAAYAGSKAAVVALTQILAREFAEFGITVNAIGPTPIETDLIKGVSSEKIVDLIGRQAIKRFGKPRDIVNVIDFFISPQSDFVTGQVVYLGGV